MVAIAAWASMDECSDDGDDEFGDEFGDEVDDEVGAQDDDEARGSAAKIRSTAHASNRAAAPFELSSMLRSISTSAHALP